MDKRIFDSWHDLVELGYFENAGDGRLRLIVDGLDGLIDFHTHFGWTFLVGRPIDLNLKTDKLTHLFSPELKVNLDIYSGQNFYEERPKWATQDYLPCALYPVRRGKHVTHTIPNLLWDMDALKIGRSVSLCLDIPSSSNSRRAAAVLPGEPRIVFYCCVSPKDRNAERKMEEFVATGARGMKIHPELQMTPVNSEMMINHLKRWREISGGLPVLFHSGFNGFEPKKAREHAAIEKYEPAAAALEDTPCILGHAAMNQYRIAVEIAKKYPNVYLEIGGQPPAHLADMIDLLGNRRLLFGTDWPVYPQAIPMAKVLITTEGDPESRIRILRDNAAELLEKTAK